MRNYWYVLCKSSDISHKLTQRTFKNTNIVLFRNKSGLCKAFVDFCPHRGVPLSIGKLSNDEIICAYHGWHFDEHGKCKKIPALCEENKIQLKPISLSEKYGLIFISFSEDVDNNKEIPVNKDPEYYRFYSKYKIYGELIDLLENFLDATHTPYIHNKLIRSSKTSQNIDAEIIRSKDMVKIVYKGEKKQFGLISKLFEKTRTYSEAVFEMPTNAEISYYSKKGLNLKIKVCLTPTRENEYNAHVFFIFKKNIINLMKFFLAWPFFYLAIKQDLKILQQQFDNKSDFGDKSYIINPRCDLIRPHLHDLIINKNFTKNLTNSLQIKV